MTTTTSAATPHPTDGPIHAWFGLTYANYLVQPRARLQSMPVEWQERMVACLTELDQAYAHLPATEYDIRAGEWVYVAELDEANLKANGITVEEHGDGEPHYIDATGRRMHPIQRVFVPGEDPNPHYNRGRTYLSPFGGEK